MLNRFMFLPLLCASGAAFAQSGNGNPAVEAEDNSSARNNEIIVIADRLKSQVDAPERPIAVYNEQDIAAYGASSIADLITATAPQTGSGRGRGGPGGGRPVVLVNGQRISNFREMRNYPPESIRKMEILPEEVALRYGFPPNQRVINFILKDNYAVKTVEAEFHQPSLGGWHETQFEASLLKINHANRFNLYARANDATGLTEAQRGVIQDPSSVPSVNTDPNPAEARSLIANTRDLIFTASWSHGLGERGMDGSIALNAGYTRNDSRSLQGLNTTKTGAVIRTFGEPLAREIGVDNIVGGASFNKRLGDWQFTSTLDGSHIRTATLSDRRASLGGGQDSALSTSNSLTSLVTMAGKALHMPAGDVATTIKAGFAYTGIDSEDSRTALATNLRRGALSSGLSFNVPLTSRKNQVLSGLGDFSLNLSAGLERLSDFGLMKDWSAGLVWSPTEKLSLQLGYFYNQAAPSLSQLGNPRIDSFNVPIFDFTRGETVLVTVTSGGNPALRREIQRDIKLSANWDLPGLKGSNLVVEYFRNRSNDVTNSFPVLTPAIEAAFPGRVVRDALGRLVSIDTRPVTFDTTQASRLRWGLNISGTLGKPSAGGPIGRTSGAGRPGGGGGGPMSMMMGGAGQGRWNFSIYHTYRFDETVQIATGGPTLNLLGGDALSGGGVARNAIEFEGGLFLRGKGFRLNGNWTGPTQVSGISNLRFGSVFKMDARVFIGSDAVPNLVKRHPFLKGMRIALEAENLFESRQRVTDANGAVPIGYQADLIDPRGRVIQIDFRKMF